MNEFFKMKITKNEREALELVRSLHSKKRLRIGETYKGRRWIVHRVAIRNYLVRDCKTSNRYNIAFDNFNVADDWYIEADDYYDENFQPDPHYWD